MSGESAGACPAAGEQTQSLAAVGSEAPSTALTLGATWTRVVGTELLCGFISPDKCKDTQPEARGQGRALPGVGGDFRPPAGQKLQMFSSSPLPRGS